MDVDRKLQGFQLIAQEKLQAVICSIPGKKDLIIEQTLIKPLEHICAASWLKLKGIQRIYKFDADNAIPQRAAADPAQVFMVRSCVLSFQRVLRHIQTERHERKQSTDICHSAAIKNFHIICVPSCFAYLAALLEADGLYGLVQLHRYNWDFIYMDQGLLSLEVPNLFAAVYLHEDTSLLPTIAHSIRVLQMITGRPELTVTLGEHSASILKMLETLGPWCKRNEAADETTPDFATLLIMDRDRDYTSSLLTPAIYAGLLLEVFHNRAGEIAIDTATNKILAQKLDIFRLPRHDTASSSTKKAREDKSAQKPPIIRLNSARDEIYGDNRYKHFAQASSQVRAQAKAIGLEVQKLNAMKLEEMHDYVARKLPKITELKSKVTRHLNASEKIIEMLGANYRKVQSLEEDILNNVSRKRILSEIDELLTTDGQQFNTLRLLCLLHHCAGISADELTTFMRNYCNYFGTRHLHIFQQLAKAALLPTLTEDEKLNKSAKLLSNLPLPKFQQTEFQANANRLNLLVGSAATDAPAASTSPASADACPSYVFNGLYIPLAAQLCTFLLKAATAEDFANKLGMNDKIQLHLSTHTTAGTAKSYATSVRQSELKDIFPLHKRNIFVYIVGGVTYAEIGACNLVSRLTGSSIVVGSDSIVSGGDLIAGAF